MFNLSLKKVTILSLSLLCCFFGEQSLKAETVTKNQSNQNLLLSESGEQDLKPPQFTITPRIVANPNLRVPLAGILSFDTDEQVTTQIEITDGEHSWKIDFDATKKPLEGLPILGMRANREHKITVVIRDLAGNQTKFQQPLNFTTPALPTGVGEFPPINVTVNKSQQLEPGITLMSVRRSKPFKKDLIKGDPNVKAFNQSFGMLLAIDEDGEPIWYYRQDSRISDFEVLKNGNIVYVTADFRAIEIDLLGNVVQTWWASRRPQGETAGIAIATDTIHHHINEVPNGNLVVLGTEQRAIANYYTSETDPDAPRKTQQVMGDLILEFQPDGQLVWEWNSFDHLDPFRIGYETFKGYWAKRGFPNTLDWTHGNSLIYDEKDDSLLVSLRYQSAIVKVKRSTGDFEWVLGESKGWPEELQDKLFTLEGDARWFYYQHSPEPTPQGTIMVYDNGTFGTRPFEPPVPLPQTYSRVVEYELDLETMTAKQVWTSEIPGEEKVVTFAVGDVDFLPQTGNVLVSYGYLLPKGQLEQFNWDNILTAVAWTRVREFKHTEPAELIWEMEMYSSSNQEGIGWIIFSSERIPSLYPE